MNGKDFSASRHQLGRSQTKMAQLLGVSPKAIQSFEQGWRKIPSYIERQLLFLLALKQKDHAEGKCCWEIRNCPMEARKECPAWEFKFGHFCWYINGTICHGDPQPNWQEKMKICRQCEVFRKGAFV
jgi:hypothetical protein